jgi:NodT family efflux transporter outer membrane factor (OMF) lipoprotein
LRLEAFLLFISLALLFTSCSFSPKYTKPSTPNPAAYKELTPDQFKTTEGWKTAEPSDALIRSNWWQMFNDSQLNALEIQAASSNQTVVAALANFLAARAVVKQARSQLFPTASVNPSVTRSRQPSISRTTASSTASTGPLTFTEFSLPLDASWELDFWGRIRNTVKANRFEAQATFADLENARLTIQAELAADYFTIRVLDSQKQVLDSAVSAYEESLRLTQVRHQTGIASDQDVAQAETQLNTTRAQDTDLGIQRAQLEHAIAVLTGQPASSFSIPFQVLGDKPFSVPFGVPSQLLERRPDIAAAERRTAEANAQIGVARAAYFPTITLSGSAGYQSIEFGKLLSAPSFAWSIGAAAAETVFDAGRRQAVTEQARAVYENHVATYRQTVLTAFQEVEDNLSTLRIISQEIQQQDTAVASSQRYLGLANERYKLGIDSFLNVITAQTILLNNQRTAVTLRLQQMTATVLLIKALGGGWEAGRITTLAVP